jgi:hypothetical protein
MAFGASLAAILNCLGASVMEPILLTPGNLLVGSGSSLREYTPNGQFVQLLKPSNHPIRNASIFDSVVDATVRLHVLTSGYLATLSADGMDWSYVAYGGNGFMQRRTIFHFGETRHGPPNGSSISISWLRPNSHCRAGTGATSQSGPIQYRQPAESNEALPQAA